MIDVKPCPKLQTGAGRVVTMTITHFNAFVLRFKIEGLSEILEPTILHPLYSEDRGEWVHAGELKEGERLRTKTGPARIEAISHKEGTYRVYNFEVEETHAYYTSTIKVLSHNSIANNCAPRVNVWGEGEAVPNFTDVATNPKFANGRQLTQGLPTGSAKEIFLRSAPIDATTLAEIERLAAPGTRITLVTPAGSTTEAAFLNKFGRPYEVLNSRPLTYTEPVTGNPVSANLLQIRCK